MEGNLYVYIIRRSLKPQLALTVIALILGLGLNPWGLKLTKEIINKAIGKGDLPALWQLCGWFLLVVVVQGGLKYVKQNVEGLVSERMLRDLRNELYQRILRFPLPHFRNTSTGQLVTMMVGEVEDLGQFFGEALSLPLFQGAMLVGSVAFMVSQSPWIALASMTLFPVQIWVVRKIQRQVTLLTRERVRLVRALSDRIQESVGGVQEIHANHTVAFESSGFRGRLQTIFGVRIRIYNLKYLAKWINNFVEKLGVFFLLLIGGWFIIQRPGSLTLGALVAFLQAYNQLNEPWRELINYFQQKENARVKYEQVIASFDPPGLRPAFPLEEAVPDPLPDLAGAYELRQATVALDGATPVLERVQLATPPREHIAVVGGSGSGKTTLTMLLAKLYAYTGTILLDNTELAELPDPVAGRRLAHVGGDARLFTGTVWENVVYGLRHRPAGAAPPDGQGAGGSDGAPDPDEWLDLSLAGVTDHAGLMAAVLEVARLTGLDEDLYALGLRATIDPARRPEVAERLLVARRLVMERFAGEGGDAAVEFFDRDRFAPYASIGENILFGHSADPALALDRLAGHEHFRRVIAEVDLESPLVVLGLEVAREMVEIFRDIPATDDLFSNFSLITANELPEYTRLVARADRTPIDDLAAEDRQSLTALALRLIPARHRLGRIDDAFMARVVAARQRFAATLPPALAASFAPYDRERYFADGTLLENMLFGKVVATSSVAVKRVNALVDEVIEHHGLREVVMETGLDFHVGLGGSRLSPVQRQKVVLARALLKRPHVLILDGALGAFEPDKRAEMHQRVIAAMKGRAVVAVVERLDLARHYDRIVVLDEGKVAETGTYQELTGRPGLFRHLATQAGLTV